MFNKSFSMYLCLLYLSHASTYIDEIVHSYITLLPAKKKVILHYYTWIYIKFWNLSGSKNPSFFYLKIAGAMCPCSKAIIRNMLSYSTRNDLFRVYPSMHATLQPVAHVACMRFMFFERTSVAFVVT